MVVTKIRQSGDLAINRTRFNPSAAGTIESFWGSNNENGRFPSKRTTCGVSVICGADCAAHTVGIAATHKTSNAAMQAQKILFMNKFINKMVPSDRRGFEIKVLNKTTKTVGSFKEVATFNVSYSVQPDPEPSSYDVTKPGPLPWV